jgi:hypothetical protein
MLVARDPVKTVAGYPDEGQLFAALAAIPGCELIDTTALTRTFRFTQAAGMVILGRAARRLPFSATLWREVLTDRLAARGAPVVERNLGAFAHGMAG